MQQHTALLLLDTGAVFYGYGFGKTGTTVAELCFNTAMTGYQEILTDPSYADQMVVFTFPHIGNVGANPQDNEADTVVARGLIVRDAPTLPSNYRSSFSLCDWAADHGLVGLYGIDTRALTQYIRDLGRAPNGVLCYAPDGLFDIDALTKQLHDWQGLEGKDLAVQVSSDAPYTWHTGCWDDGYTDVENANAPLVVCVDDGVKQNILRCLVQAGCRVQVVPATTPAAEILGYNPAGIMLSNGPGDPAATGAHAIPEITRLLESGKPIFGICLGFQLLGLALGAKTAKMPLGHHGANHPVQDIETGKVEITSQNHGFHVLTDSLPVNVKPTHFSLFDGTLQGFRCTDKPVFAVQFHPEAAPGPQDSFYLFQRFVGSFGA